MVVLGAIIALLTLQLPALTPDEALKRSPDGQKKMVVSGHVTSARWPGMAPAAHRIADGRYLLHDSYDDSRAWIWSPKTKKLTALGQATLAQVPRAGLLVVTHANDRATYHDVDPKKNALRALWTEPSATERVQTWIAGSTTSGAPVIVSRTTKGAKLITIRDAGSIEEREIALPAKADIASGDALRGNRLLLIEGDHGSALETPVMNVSVLDVATGEIRGLGAAKGCHTTMTGGIHPYVDVTWKDHDPQVKRPGYENGCPVLVDAASGTIEQGRTSPF